MKVIDLFIKSQDEFIKEWAKSPQETWENSFYLD
jgi:hypothetical protein